MDFHRLSRRLPGSLAIFTAGWLLACAGAGGVTPRTEAKGASSADDAGSATVAVPPTLSPAAGAPPVRDVPPDREEATNGGGTSEGNRVVAAPSAAPLALPSKTKVLQIGDSFAGALGVPLGQMLEAEGINSILKATDASYIVDWAWRSELQKDVWRYNPDLVLITLGANELLIEDPTQRIKAIRKVVELVGARPCVWVAIPLWSEKHNQLLDVIRDNANPCLFLDTNALVDVEHMPRMKDGIHPTQEARIKWAAFVLDWLRTHRVPTDERPWRLAP